MLGLVFFNATERCGKLMFVYLEALHFFLIALTLDSIADNDRIHAD